MMKLSFMTFATPDWDLNRILTAAIRYGYDGIEPRSEAEHKHGVELETTKKQGKEMLAAIQEEAIERLGYFLKPSELFHKVAEKGARKADNFILGDLGDILKHIEASTMGHWGRRR